MAKLIKIEQGSERWKRERQGRITASRFGDVIAKPNTKRYQEYLSTLVDERLGFVSDTQEAEEPWYQHGKAFEPRARSAYEMKFGVDLANNFMLVHPEHDYITASPDGSPIDLSSVEIGQVVEMDVPKVVEIKGRLYWRSYHDAVLKGLESHYKPQVQGQLWLAGCEYAELVNYYECEPTREHPKGVRKMHVTTIAADKAYHSFLEEACMCFELEIRKATREAA